MDYRNFAVFAVLFWSPYLWPWICVGGQKVTPKLFCFPGWLVTGGRLFDNPVLWHLILYLLKTPRQFDTVDWKLPAYFKTFTKIYNFTSTNKTEKFKNLQNWLLCLTEWTEFWLQRVSNQLAKSHHKSTLTKVIANIRRAFNVTSTWNHTGWVGLWERAKFHWFWSSHLVTIIT